MPSDTVMVLNGTLLPPAASAPAPASRASSAMCMLQGVRFDQVEAMPICGLEKSASPKPTARNIARAGVCLSPSTTRLEYLRILMGCLVLLHFGSMHVLWRATSRILTKPMAPAVTSPSGSSSAAVPQLGPRALQQFVAGDAERRGDQVRARPSRSRARPCSAARGPAWRNHYGPDSSPGWRRRS